MKTVTVLVVALVPASLALAIAFGSVELSAAQLADALLGRGDEAARHCGFSVLLYDAGRASLGRSSEMLTQANLEALYQCRLDEAGARSFLPS